MQRTRLRTILALLVLVTTLPAAVLAVWLIPRWWTQQRALIERQNVEQARAISVAVDQEIGTTIASLNVLALLEQIDAPDKTHFTEIATRVLPLHPGWESLRLIDPTLRVLASTAGQPAVLPLRYLDWVRVVLDTGQPAVSKAVRDPASGRWMINVGVPVRRGGALKYVLSAGLYTHAFSAILEQQKLPPGGVVALLDTSPVIMARTRNEDKYLGRAATPEFVERSRSSPEGSGRSTMLEGSRAYSAWSQSNVTGWTVGVAMPSDAVDAPARRSLIVLIAAGAGAVGGGLVLSLLLGSRIVRAQTAAAAAARSLARGEGVPPFRSTIAEAADLWEGLRDAATILDRRLRERDEAQAEADRHRAALFEQEQSARRAAEALSHAKDEFVATVSHELRTPLNAIFGWTAMLRTGTLDEARRAHALDVIDRNTRAQAKLIEDLLDMSRAIQGIVRLEMERVDLASVLDAALDSLRPTAAAREIDVRVEVERETAIVSGDHGRLQQVLWNVLANSLKFTPRGGRVSARLTTEGREAVVRISDSGEGIAPEFLPHVFDRFRQEVSDVTRAHSGLGLGLALVRHLIELHGGTITAESAGKGNGASFTIRLPLLGSDRAQIREPAVPTALAISRAGILNGRHVLVVDDDDDTRELVAVALEQAGARAVKAATVAAAVAAIDVQVPDVVVSDIAMPTTSGYDLVRQLRADPRTATVPIIALTAYSRMEDRDFALAAGFTAHLGKPLEPRALVSLLSRLAPAETDTAH
jgi:signal transduction histidine kinase/ActR/RegA family two-component response regulator